MSIYVFKIIVNENIRDIITKYSKAQKHPVNDFTH